MLQNNSVLKNKIDQLWNKFWSSGISNPLTAIEQITYLLFMKRLDDLDSKQKSYAKSLGQKFVSRFSKTWVPPEHRDKSKIDQRPFEIQKHTLRWSQFKIMEAEEMLSHVQTRVFPFLKDLNGQESNFTHHMKNAVFVIHKPSLLVDAIKIIDEIYMEIEKDGQAFQDIQGDVYEYLLSEIASAGKNGQFRTPRHIIKLIAELVQPQLGDYIIDPACGSGGFLLGAYQYIVTKLAEKNKGKLQKDEDGFFRSSVSVRLNKSNKKKIGESLYGYDVDSTMVRLGLMNLMMHGIDEPHIDYRDTLSKNFNEVSKYDIVMANPPFTGNIDKGDINESFCVETTKTELLFIENIFRLLKKGGTAGVIIPQGVLFGNGKAFVEVRKILVDYCSLKAVISLPSGVFKPYAGVSTAILIFTKVYSGAAAVIKPATKSIWFYNMESDGYSLDDKRNKLEGYGDLQDIVKKYNRGKPRNHTGRNEKYFSVPYKEIKDNNYDLSIGRYKENVFEEIQYKDPIVILQQLITHEVGDDVDDKTLAKIKGGIVKELLLLKGMVQ